MKKKEATYHSLDLIRNKFDKITTKANRTFVFEAEFFALTLFQVWNVYFALFYTSFHNYNFALMGLNTCVPLRRLTQSTHFHLLMQDPLKRDWKFTGLLLLSIGYTITMVHCIAVLLLTYTCNVFKGVILPIAIFCTMCQRPPKKRYLKGYEDCFYGLKRILIQSIEVTYCAGYLPIHFISENGLLINTHPYLNALMLLAFTTFAVQFGEFMRKRSLELSFHAKRTGRWTKVSSDPLLHEKWNPDTTYSKGQLVSYKGSVFRASSSLNASEPCKVEPCILHSLFKSPSKAMLNLNFVTTGLVILQLVIFLELPLHPSCLVSFVCLVYVLLRNIRIYHKVVKQTFN